MRMIALATVAIIGLMLAGCSSTPIPPTYSQEELKAMCERHGSVWHPDSLMGGFCEPVHS